MAIQTKRLFLISVSTLVLLSIPLVAMLYTDEVNWSLFDFIIGGALLLGTGLLLELVIRKTANKNKRLWYVIAIIGLLILIWMELAVGIFGSPIAGS